MPDKKGIIHVFCTSLGFILPASFIAVYTRSSGQKYIQCSHIQSRNVHQSAHIHKTTAATIKHKGRRHHRRESVAHVIVICSLSFRALMMMVSVKCCRIVLLYVSVCGSNITLIWYDSADFYDLNFNGHKK